MLLVYNFIVYTTHRRVRVEQSCVLQRGDETPLPLTFCTSVHLSRCRARSSNDGPLFPAQMTVYGQTVCVLRYRKDKRVKVNMRRPKSAVMQPDITQLGLPRN
ncbi:hypothetical protein F2P81_023183 [Scophthalmus maximus]|uniref:Uncharacterized protein n=1 Tax=Scophthalmus maximus TaxID=52904 RepID=A0A6A4RZH2_SCOMX|nr:hypothetical protein F2P81_023183 [Scophthalmus maximus]